MTPMMCGKSASGSWSMPDVDNTAFPAPAIQVEDWEWEIIGRYPPPPQCLPWWSLICPTKRHSAMINQLGVAGANQMVEELNAARKRRR